MFPALPTLRTHDWSAMEDISTTSHTLNHNRHAF